MPLIVWEGALFDDLGMTGPVSGIDFGEAFSKKKIVILQPSHPLAAGRRGTIIAVDPATRFNWGVPGPGGTVVAHVGGAPTQPAVFAYESGATMSAGVAPARRVGLFLYDNTASEPHRGRLGDIRRRRQLGPRLAVAKRVRCLSRRARLRGVTSSKLQQLWRSKIVPRKTLLAVLVILALTAVACSGGGGGASTELAATVKEFQFTPSTWTVPAGQQITIDVTNQGTTTHEWVLLQPGVTITSEDDLPETEEELLANFVYVEEEVEVGETKTLTFEAPPAGTYQVICAIEGHFNAGMEGTLTSEG